MTSAEVHEMLVMLLALALPSRDTVPLFDNLGDYSRPVTAVTPLAQRYFDQGLRLTYAFNHAEAIRAFEEAGRLDPGCGMCFFGVAYALGPNINAPMDSASEARAHEAIRRAQAVAARGTAVERDLIGALAERYGSPGGDRVARDSAWARAAAALATRYPDDDDVLTLAADAAMNLRPWNYWRSGGDPQPGTAELLDRLERVITRLPDHPGACHLYIHAVEAAHPERAVPCAERLAALMPGAGHVVHMPAHIYIRVGRYADAVSTNRHAVHADELYLATPDRPSGLYLAGYYPHNYHFLAFAAAFAGMSREAITAAAAASARVPPEIAAQVPWIEPILVYHPLVLQVFGRWEDLLAVPEPPAALVAATALSRFARGMAYANLDRLPAARAAADRIREAVPRVDDEQLRIAVEIGQHVLSGEIASKENRLDAGIEHLRAAAALEDGMVYNEPPLWHQPVRHLLGALLLRAGRPADAERVYREDLRRFPGNGWSLFGLAEALRAQGKTREAADTAERFRVAWRAADVPLAASRF